MLINAIAPTSEDASAFTVGQQEFIHCRGAVSCNLDLKGNILNFSAVFRPHGRARDISRSILMSWTGWVEPFHGVLPNIDLSLSPWVTYCSLSREKRLFSSVLILIPCGKTRQQLHSLFLRPATLPEWENTDARRALSESPCGSFEYAMCAPFPHVGCLILLQGSPRALLFNPMRAMPLAPRLDTPCASLRFPRGLVQHLCMSWHTWRHAALDRALSRRTYTTAGKKEQCVTLTRLSLHRTRCTVK